MPVFVTQIAGHMGAYGWHYWQVNLPYPAKYDLLKAEFTSR